MADIESIEEVSDVPPAHPYREMLTHIDISGGPE